MHTKMEISRSFLIIKIAKNEEELEIITCFAIWRESARRIFRES
jgi:hypothetical protein